MESSSSLPGGCALSEAGRLAPGALPRPPGTLVVQSGDEELMALVRAGDAEAFRQIVERYQDPLVNYLTRLTRSHERAEDYAQEAFVRLYHNAARYRESGRLAGYLFRIATNLLRSEERRRRRWRVLSESFLAEQPRRVESSAQTRLLGGEATERVSDALASLPLRYRAPVVLREIEGWSYAEIAESLGCREGTIKSRISRGKERLRRLLEPYWQGVG